MGYGGWSAGAPSRGIPLGWAVVLRQPPIVFAIDIQKAKGYVERQIRRTEECSLSRLLPRGFYSPTSPTRIDSVFRTLERRGSPAGSFAFGRRRFCAISGRRTLFDLRREGKCRT